jgi:molecular chaperone GrpE
VETNNGKTAIELLEDLKSFLDEKYKSIISKGTTNETLKKRIEVFAGAIAELKDKALRNQAEFENFRKRMNKEKLEAIDFANQSLILDIIPILDDFDRALASAGNSNDFYSLYDGIKLISMRLTNMLYMNWGLKSYASSGNDFDPNYHEALAVEKSSAVNRQIVKEDLLKGYTLKNKIIRTNKVKVLDPDPSAPFIEAPKHEEPIY